MNSSTMNSTVLAYYSEEVPTSTVYTHVPAVLRYCSSWLQTRITVDTNVSSKYIYSEPKPFSIPG